MKDYRLIIFDLDGTLADTSEGIYNSIRYTQEKMNLYPPETEEQMRSHIGPPVEESYNRIFGLTGERLQQAAAYHKEYALQKGLYEARLYDGIPELLAQLKPDHRLAVATLKFEETANKMLTHLGIAHYFDIICGAIPGQHTTKLDTLQRAMLHCHAIPDQTLLIGDSQYDAIGAQQAGMDFLAVTYGFGFKNEDNVNRHLSIGILSCVSMMQYFFYNNKNAYINFLKELSLKKMIQEGKTDQFLYVYKKNNNYTKGILENQILWFSRPREFNDPYDCFVNPVDFNEDDAKDYVIKIAQSESLSTEEIQFNKKLDRKWLKGIIDKKINEIGVCCFTKIPDNTLMWSHYANCHKGICFQFDILRDPLLFSFMLPVDYVDKMPVYNHFKEHGEIVNKIIKSKFSVWEYEQEIRVIKTNVDIEGNGGQAFHFNPRSLRKIIFGCKTSNYTIKKYRQLCDNDAFRHVRFSKMEQAEDGSFTLIEKQIN